MCETKKTPSPRFGEPDDCAILRRKYARQIEHARSAGDALHFRKRELAAARFRALRAGRADEQHHGDLSERTPKPRVDRPWYRGLGPTAVVSEGLTNLFDSYMEVAVDGAVNDAQREVRRAQAEFDQHYEAARAAAELLKGVGCRYTPAESLLRRYI